MAMEQELVALPISRHTCPKTAIGDMLANNHLVDSKQMVDMDRADMAVQLQADSAVIA
jgi:hypothetical protein